MFDGRQRFDLVITPKRSVSVKRTTPAGYGGPAVICGVKFIPIAGYHPDNPAVRLMSQTNEIEVWLVPVRGTRMYVPYRIVLPTLAGYGSAVVTSLRVSRRAPRQRPALTALRVNGKAQNPRCGREQMSKINPPLIRACSVPVAFSTELRVGKPVRGAAIATLRGRTEAQRGRQCCRFSLERNPNVQSQRFGRDLFPPRSAIVEIGGTYG